MNKRQVKKILSDCAIDPNKPGPVQLILTVGNSDYYIQRALEFISQSQINKRADAGWHEELKAAIGLLALSMVPPKEAKSKRVSAKQGCSCGHPFKAHRPFADDPRMPCVISGCSCPEYTATMKESEEQICKCSHPSAMHTIKGKRLCKAKDCRCCHGFEEATVESRVQIDR